MLLLIPGCPVRVSYCAASCLVSFPTLTACLHIRSSLCPPSWPPRFQAFSVICHSARLGCCSIVHVPQNAWPLIPVFPDLCTAAWHARYTHERWSARRFFIFWDDQLCFFPFDRSGSARFLPRIFQRAQGQNSSVCVLRRLFAVRCFGYYRVADSPLESPRRKLLSETKVFLPGLISNCPIPLP